ncbi:phosphoenolpyruvate carboxykinase [Oleomonas cavernae]|uniref:Phosphoenolpyruvate carboxykinase (ATP) n=1 Tax=Oleomonas cavernae TaxID=2320859 RepID=A0A418WGB5_9PROT|nr:phosphoenolpyruvate carboxykinase [Oleomonas cavernae]RJF89074.1 phosphoenolpyruvate carboxykinase [Oleomonas cavernae]
MRQTGTHISRHGLDLQGIRNVSAAYWNLDTPALYEEAIRRSEGVLAEGGPLVVKTGQHTGRSASDKFTVKDAETESAIWWGKSNVAITPEAAAGLRAKVRAYLEGKEIFVQDLYGGADPANRVKVRVVTEFAWHSLFIRNLLVRPAAEDLPDFLPEFTIIDMPSLLADPAVDGTKSGTFIVVDFAAKTIVIGGTSYAGEIKKSVFTILNYLLPVKGVMPMHCSINVGKAGDSAVFFGLSGTGKTTLSADPERELIGDDEHGWSEHGVFNFEGGCYAKMIRLSPTAEPEIYSTTKRFGTVLENVVIDPVTRKLDLDDASLAENSRGAYPLDFIANASATGIAGHPKNIIMLTADAFGVLPPISRLSPEQAMYHFLSGYTAKVAGTEKGLGKEPQATFSTCFGAPFMPRHPTVYGNILKDKIARHGASCWLVNTGWTGGEYGTGSRMPIAVTRALLRAALDGSLNQVQFRIDPNFGFEVPVAVPGVPTEILDPRQTWADKAAYDAKAKHLVGLFIDNFAQFEAHVDDAIRSAAPKAA